MWGSIRLGVLLLSISGAWADCEKPTAREKIYREWTLRSGDALHGQRESSAASEGADAACVRRHRRSEKGAIEGRIVIPLKTAKYLARPGIGKTESTDLPHDVTFPERSSFTDASPARTIRDGIGPVRHTPDPTMPRYGRDTAAMALLIDYLKELLIPPPTGVTEEILHFATVITPDADPIKRKGMLQVLRRFFAAQTSSYSSEDSSSKSSRRKGLRVRRKWRLHVWELKGPQESWEQQLRDRLQVEPVFAVVSGVGGRTWEPVHRFCQQASLPCLLPNVDLPVVAEDDYYNIYFSKGVLLEAQLIARQLQEISERSGRLRVIQVFRNDDIGAEAAREVQASAGRMNFRIMNYVLGVGAPKQELSGALNDMGAGDAVVLWLRPDDLRHLPATEATTAEVFVSGLMGDLEHSPLPAVWRRAALMAYPCELPVRRVERLNDALGWLALQHIPVVDERIQTDTYIACSVLAESLGPRLDDFVRDYLVQRIEVMLSTRFINGYYGRLGLARGQRFAASGGYIVRLVGSQGMRLIPETDWTVL